MGKKVDVVLWIIIIILSLNVMGLLYRFSTSPQCCVTEKLPTPATATFFTGSDRPRPDYNRSSGDRLIAPSPLVPITYFMPPGRSVLSSSHLEDSLTRVGTDLAFEPSRQCPGDSAMLTSWEQRIPLHSSCPAVFVIGARKGGTTSLYEYLSHHPRFEGILLDKGPSAGETFYFSDHYSTEPWHKYRSRYPKQGLMTGDSSVGNLVDCNVPKRILESCGNFSKVVLLLRNPVDRYVSNFRMRARLRTAGYSNNTNLASIINLDMKKFTGALNQKGYAANGAEQWDKLTCLYKPSRNMLFEGLYYVHLMNWLCNYPAENIIIANSEEFFTNSTKILKQIYQFLGLEPLSHEERKQITSFVFNKGGNTNLAQHKLTPADSKKLHEFYSPYNKPLLSLLRWDGTQW